MRQQAESFAEQDAERREIAEVRNRADNALYVADKVQNQPGTRPVAEVMVEIDAKKRDLRVALSSDNLEAIKEATSELLHYLDQTGMMPPPGTGPVEEDGSDDAQETSTQI